MEQWHFKWKHYLCVIVSHQHILAKKNKKKTLDICGDALRSRIFTVVKQLLMLCLKSFFTGSGLCADILKRKKSPAAKCNLFFPSVNNGDLCAVKEGPSWMSSMVYLQQQTHRWGWFSSFCSADESEILGLISTEWGRSVLCNHWYVIWRRCGGERERGNRYETISENINGRNMQLQIFLSCFSNIPFDFSQCIPGVILR